MHSVQQRKLKLLVPVLSLEVSLVKLWNHFTASSKPSYQHIENETAVDEGKAGSSGGRGGLMKMECSI